jgi:nitrogen regulatory protein P-II 1
MAFKYVIAILQPEVIVALEAQLSRIGVGGITLTRVKGFGDYKNFFSRDWATDHTKAELFVDEARVAALLDLLRQVTNAAAPGVVAVVPVDSFHHLHAGFDAAAPSPISSIHEPTGEVGTSGHSTSKGLPT